ncbi:MAG: DUF4249 domain-containing protein [Bacteroidota bacterium]
MKKKIFLILNLLVILIISCEREVDIVMLDNFIQKLVIHSFITNHNTYSFVSVKSNERIYGEINSQETPGNLNLTISNGVKVVSLERYNDGYIFRHEDMPVEGGKTYRLRVTSDKGMSAEASCTVPAVRDFHLEADTLWEYEEIPGVGKWNVVRANVYLTDYPGEANYFRFITKILVYEDGYLPEFSSEGEEPAFFSDEGRDGERIFANTLTVAPWSDSDSAFLIFYILNTDKAYYTYHRSWDNYSGGENPFMEVSPVYSNIEGGLGIFASYVVDSLVLKLK